MARFVVALRGVGTSKFAPPSPAREDHFSNHRNPWVRGSTPCEKEENGPGVLAKVGVALLFGVDVPVDGAE